MVDSLWGDDFSIKEDNVKAIKEKVKKPKVVKEKTKEQLLRSKTVSIDDKLKIIRDEVYKVLGRNVDKIVTIKTYDDLVKYIDAAIDNGVIAIDTETGDDNGYGTLNTFDCHIMGACLYTPGQKYAYVPVNHTDMEGNKLSWQITEDQLHAQFQRVKDSGIFEVYHNASFDIEVIMTTCNIRLKADWDTLVAAQLIDENEPKGLKAQYTLHIDPEQAKYNIEKLFQGLPYSIIDPDLFALYAATDAGDTLKLFEWQRNILRQPDLKDVYWLYQNIEIPVIDAVVDMEMNGVHVDVEYDKRISKIYHEKLDALQEKVDEELIRLKPTIDKWRETPEANARQTTAAGKLGKAKTEQLADPPELSSPTQMAILLYDVLHAPVVDKKNPRGTGAEILEELSRKLPICDLLIKKRGVDILLDTFIDAIPEAVQKDGRVHARFNQCGAGTGRFSSSSPNLQNIPSHAKDIRLIFDGGDSDTYITCDDNVYAVRYTDEIEVEHDTWKFAKDITVGDTILNSEGSYDIVSRIDVNDGVYYFYV